MSLFGGPDPYLADVYDARSIWAHSKTWVEPIYKCKYLTLPYHERLNEEIRGKMVILSFMFFRRRMKNENTTYL